MQIAMTVGLLAELGLQKAALPDSDAFFLWKCGVAEIGRRKALLCVNAETGFVAAFAFTKTMLSKLPEHIESAIRSALEWNGAPASLIDKYVREAGKIEFGKSSDRSLTARLNGLIADISRSFDRLEDGVLQMALTREANRLPVKGGLPAFRMTAAFAERYKDRAVSMPAAELLVSLDLNGIPCWRKLSVPVTSSLCGLRTAIHKCFGWSGADVGEFEFETVLPKTDDLRAIPLFSLFPRNSGAAYRYGCWTINLELLRMLGDTERNFPAVLMGDGDAPREIVRGIPEFESLTDAMDMLEADPKRQKQLAELRDAGTIQFDLKAINAALRQPIE